MSTEQVQEKIKTDHGFNFWFHLFITVLAWIGPFLFTWYLMITAYMIVLVQFMIFGRCLLNKSHGLEDDGESTFYSYLLEQVGFKPERKVLRVWVRNYIYIILTAVTVLWQLVLGFEPLLF